MFEAIRKIFKAAPQQEVAWGETSKMYVGANIPKYNPDDLVGRKGLLIYPRMMTDEQVKAVVRFKRDAITSRQFYFQSEHKELSEEENAARIELCNAIITRMAGSWGDVFNGIMSAMYMGFSLSEKVFQQIEVGGKTWMGVKAVKVKPANTFLFHVDQFSNIIKVTQQLGGHETDIEIDSFIHYVQNPDVDSHYGQSELRECYRSWFSKDMAIRFQNIHLERFAGGFVVATPEGNKTIQPNSADHINLQNILSNINGKTSILLPSGIKLEVHQPATSDIYERAIAQHDKAIAKALLVPNLMGISEQGTTGSFAQSQTQLEAFLWTLESDSGRLCEVLNEQLWKQLGDQNWGDGYYPEMCFKPISEKRKMDIIGKWKDLVGAGAVEATDTDEEHLRDLLDFPEKGEAISKPQPVVKPVAQPGQPEKPAQPAKPDITAQEETIVGKSLVSASAFTRAMKRVDFAVIGNKADNSASDSAHEVASINGQAVARMVADAEALKLGTAEGLPTDVFKIKFNADELSSMKKAVGAGIKEAWSIGMSHGKRELQKARASFAANDLALQDVAANWLKSKEYTITGDISTATQRRIQGLLVEGVKVSKTFAETKTAIYKALEADGLITEEDVVTALGAATVKDASARINTIMRTSSFEAINEARYELFSSPDLEGFVEALEYGAILDDRTTEICSNLNGETYPIDDPIWQTYRPPNHYGCRSILIPVTQNDTWTASAPPDVMPQKGFGFAKSCGCGSHPAQEINIHPHIHMSSPDVQVEQRQPVINVAAPVVHVAAPVVHLEANLPEQNITVTLPSRRTHTTVKRDSSGNLVSATQVESDMGN